MKLENFELVNSCPEADTNISREMKRITKKLSSVHIEKVIDCIRQHKGFTCYHAHPICLIGKDNTTLVSPPCRDQCYSNEICKMLLNSTVLCGYSHTNVEKIGQSSLAC